MLGNIEAFIEAARERLKVVAEFSATDFFKGGDAELVTTFVNDLSMTVEAMDLGFDMLSEMAPVKAIKDTIDYTSAVSAANHRPRDEPPGPPVCWPARL